MPVMALRPAPMLKDMSTKPVCSSGELLILMYSNLRGQAEGSSVLSSIVLALWMMAIFEFTQSNPVFQSRNLKCLHVRNEVSIYDDKTGVVVSANDSSIAVVLIELSMTRSEELGLNSFTHVHSVTVFLFRPNIASVPVLWGFQPIIVRLLMLIHVRVESFEA